MINYNRKKIEGLDPRQCIYLNHHDEQFGTEQLVMNACDFHERTKENKPSVEVIDKALEGYRDREAYIWNNMRGWCLVFRTESNENMFHWDNIEKVN